MPETPDWFEEGWPHIWLPYTQMKTAQQPLPVVGAEGSKIKLADGRELIDGIASWWSMCHGYQHPVILEAMQTQLDTLSHVMFAGLAHEPAYRLAKRLTAMAPDGLERVFFSDSGSTAVEVALKICLQYWRNQGNARKNKFICFHHGYHGDTFGTMSVSGRSTFNNAFEGLLARHYVMDIPNDEYSAAECEETVSAIAPTVAGLIIEPLVQGAGGMRFHSADILYDIRRICRENDILFIADEVMTGFCRTGSVFACDEAGITPDILCLGKALTAGHVPLAATLTTADIFDAFYDNDLSKCLMHGPTFMANPLACAAANASLDLFRTEDRLSQVEHIESHFLSELSPLSQLQGIRDIRVKGAIGVVQLDATQEDMFALRPQLIEKGVWLRPFGNIVYAMPPLTISEEELMQLTNAIRDVLSAWLSKFSR